MSKSADLFRRRQELGVALRELRESAGLSGSRLAARLGTSQSKVSKIETGLARPTAAEIEDILDALEAPRESRVRIRELGKIPPLTFTPFASVRQRGAQHKQRIVAAWENESSEVRVFATSIVPGLLQTPTYIRSLMRLERWFDGGESEPTVMARVTRQNILYDPGKQLRFLVTEAALRSRICSGIAMASQLEHIATISKLPTVNVGVLPWQTALPEVYLNHFYVLDERWVLIETTHGELRTRDRRDIDFYFRLFESVNGVALHGDAAREFLREVADEHRGLPD